MNEEEKRMLEETLALVKENNEMLQKVRRIQKMNFFFKILYWVLIIGVAVGLFYFLQPFVDQLKGAVKETNETFQEFKNLIP